MEAKSVIKQLTVFCTLAGFINTVYSQNTKYLFFDNYKDTTVVDLDKTRYYKIDKNLFEITRYNDIDTICKNTILKTNYTTVQQLWKEGEKINDSIFSEEIKKKKIRIIESYNQIFEIIYVIEKITDTKYKRTRVWWVDY